VITKIVLSIIVLLRFIASSYAQEPVVVRIAYQPTSSAIILGKAKGFYDQAFTK
jgi:hypothetical protein